MTSTNHADDYIVSLLKDVAEGEPAQVIEKLRAAALAHPADPRALVLLAAEFASVKAYDEAEAAYIGALQRSPDYALARFQLGLLQFTQGRQTTASATWDALSILPAAHEYRLFAKGFGLLAQERLNEAAAAIEAGIAANHSNAPLNQDMQRVLGRIAAARAAQAAAADETALADADADHFLVSSYRKSH